MSYEDQRIENAWRVDPDPVTAVSDATVGSTSEENLLDVGADAGTQAYRLDGGHINVVSLGTNTTITIKAYVEINGTLTEVASEDRTATGVFNVRDLLGDLASRHVRITVQGDNAADDGQVDATFVTSAAGV